jgi:hypothetical protein
MPASDTAVAVFHIMQANTLAIQANQIVLKQFDVVHALLAQRPSPLDIPQHLAELESAQEVLKIAKADYDHAAAIYDRRMAEFEDEEARAAPSIASTCGSFQFSCFSCPHNFLFINKLQCVFSTQFCTVYHSLASAYFEPGVIWAC